MQSRGGAIRCGVRNFLWVRSLPHRACSRIGRRSLQPARRSPRLDLMTGDRTKCGRDRTKCGRDRIKSRPDRSCGPPVRLSARPSTGEDTPLNPA